MEKGPQIRLLMEIIRADFEFERWQCVFAFSSRASLRSFNVCSDLRMFHFIRHAIAFGTTILLHGMQPHFFASHKNQVFARRYEKVVN